MMRTILPAPKQKRQLDVALPIVNIVLLLIFFFLVSGQLLKATSYPVALSEVASLEIKQLPSPVLVLEDDGSWVLDGQPIAPDLLKATLANQGADILHLVMERTEPATELLSFLANPALADVEIRLVTFRREEAIQ